MSFSMETGKLTLSSSDTGTINFTLDYRVNPVIILTPEAGINVFVESISKTSAVIRTSNLYSGDIHYQIISND